MHFLRRAGLLLAFAASLALAHGQDAGLSEIDPEEGDRPQDDWADFDGLFDEDLDDDDEPSLSINDPFVRLNRAIFKFNDKAYHHVAKPITRGYRRVMPAPFARGIGNAFRNIKYPTRFVGSVLQGKFKRAGKETGKFLINSTAGIGGLFDVAKNIDGLNPPAEDIGQAFGSWGMGHGFYLVLPLLGPTSLRDFTGSLAGSAVEPLPKPWSQVDDPTTRAALQGIETLNQLPALMDLYDSMRRSAIDPYISVRDAYTQIRARQLAE